MTMKQPKDQYTPCKPWVSDTNRMYQFIGSVNGLQLGLCSYLREKIVALYYLDISTTRHGCLALFEDDDKPLAYLRAVNKAEQIMIELWKTLQQH